MRAKDYQFLVGLLLIGVMIGLRRLASFVGGRTEGIAGTLARFFSGQWGGTLLVFLTSALAGLGSALAAHAEVNAGLFLDVAKLALLAAGGWSALVKPLGDLIGKLFGSGESVVGSSVGSKGG